MIYFFNPALFWQPCPCHFCFVCVFFLGMSQRLHGFRQMFDWVLLSSVFRIHTECRVQDGGSSSERLLTLMSSLFIKCQQKWRLVTFKEQLNLIWPSSLHFSSCPAPRACVHYCRLDKITCSLRLLLLHFTCANIVVWCELGVKGHTNWKHSWNTLGHAWPAGKHTCVIKKKPTKKNLEAGAWDVATDVLNTCSFPCWQNVKIDSGAGRWKGQWACFARV